MQYLKKHNMDKPKEDEILSNPRSRSAKLNILEKANEDYV